MFLNPLKAVGAVHLIDAHKKTLDRTVQLPEDAASRGAQVVLFPECALTAFFPHHFIAYKAQLKSGKELGVDICIGFAEASDAGEHYNTCIYYRTKSGSMLPRSYESARETLLQAERLGFHAFRAKAWKALGLQGAEMVFCGYNTTGFAPYLWGTSINQDPKEAEKMALSHHKLVMQAHSYTNACFFVSAAKSGRDDGNYNLIAGSTIIRPHGKVIAESMTDEDGIIIGDCDLDRCRPRIVLNITSVCFRPSFTKTYRTLLCNLNATELMTDACLGMVRPTILPNVFVYGFTAPKPAPSSIEGNFDNITLVIGIMEASLLAARTLGIGSCNLDVLELESRPEKEVLGIICEVGKKLVDGGADILTLGCTGMTNMKATVENVVRDEVPVVDGTAKKGAYASSAVGRKKRSWDWI
ncbi:carbon-nitrogen hydrolase [Lindgomyces ingoldianus]|uniref:Carbon-nitrogen hydrolase n=1 Tax=Lindgomyces ingoldianus TaxID=673940 RepID=A0ACB6RDC0_9PLEO|nr:carbon-nitrogen hydrolase [Lindgomyces ingoldianus]KAF2476725.1 carbon-nitrogen hydrolase [Lindgomyces ingoldianus]